MKDYYERRYSNWRCHHITAIYHCNMRTMIECSERHIIGAGPDVTPGIPEEELTWFRDRVSNPDNVRQYLECWVGVERDVEEGLREGGGGDDYSDNLEIFISDDKDKDDDDDDDEIADFICDDEDEDENEDEDEEIV